MAEDNYTRYEVQEVLMRLRSSIEKKFGGNIEILEIIDDYIADWDKPDNMIGPEFEELKHYLAQNIYGHKFMVIRIGNDLYTKYPSNKRYVEDEYGAYWAYKFYFKNEINGSEDAKVLGECDFDGVLKEDRK